MINSISFAIRKFFLQFDFSKKIIFILSTSIFAAIYLFLNVYFTERIFIQIIERQIQGLDFHKRAMSIFDSVTKMQSQFFWALPEEKAQLKDLLKLTDSFYTPLINDIRNHFESSDLDSSNFYTQRLDIYNKKIHQILNRLDDDNLETFKNQKTLKLDIIDLKNTILSFIEIINEMYDLELAMTRIEGLQFDLLLDRLPSFQSLLGDSLTLTNRIMTPKTLSKIDVYSNLLEENLNSISEDGQSFSEIQELANFQVNATQFLNLFSKMQHESQSENFINEFHQVGYKTLISSIDLYDALSKTLKKSLASQAKMHQGKQILSFLLLLLGTSLILIPYLMKAFRRPLFELKIAAEKLAEGNLSVRIPITYTNEVSTVSASFNKAADVFEQIISATNHFAGLLSQSAEKMFSIAKNLEKNLGLQEITVYDIKENSKDIVKTVKDFYKPLEQVNDSIRKSAQQIHLSRENLNEMEAIMQNMASSAQNTIKALSTINLEIDNIKSVIHTLIMIADQINLLSLNTAIRARKAGSKLGFSVIAEKTHELAGQTAFTTLNLEEVVQKILSIISEIIKEVDQFSLEIKESIEDSIAVKKTFQELLNIIQVQNSSFNSINISMQGQTEKTAAIDKSINELNNSIQKTSQSIRNLYVEIEYLYHATNRLNNMTKR